MESEPRRKLLYRDSFEPRDWIVPVSACVDELPQLVDDGDFRELVSSLETQSEGALLLDSGGRVLLHRGDGRQMVTFERIEELGWLAAATVDVEAF